MVLLLCYTCIIMSDSVFDHPNQYQSLSGLSLQLGGIRIPALAAVQHTYMYYLPTYEPFQHDLLDIASLASSTPIHENILDLQLYRLPRNALVFYLERGPRNEKTHAHACTRPGLFSNIRPVRQSLHLKYAIRRVANNHFITINCPSQQNRTCQPPRFWTSQCDEIHKSGSAWW